MLWFKFCNGFWYLQKRYICWKQFFAWILQSRITVIWNKYVFVPKNRHTLHSHARIDKVFYKQINVHTMITLTHIHLLFLLWMNAMNCIIVFPNHMHIGMLTCCPAADFPSLQYKNRYNQTLDGILIIVVHLHCVCKELQKQDKG